MDSKVPNGKWSMLIYPWLYLKSLWPLYLLYFSPKTSKQAVEIKMAVELIANDAWLRLTGNGMS